VGGAFFNTLSSVRVDSVEPAPKPPCYERILRGILAYDSLGTEVPTLLDINKLHIFVLKRPGLPSE
jgi:hypothetical protein